MKNLIVFVLFLFLTQGLFGCATKNQKIELIKKRAVFDLDCSSINVLELGNNVFGVKGCGKRNTYIVDCTDILISDCTAIMNSDAKNE